MGPVTAPATVFYDADCGFCVWCVAKVMRWDRSGELRYLPLQDPASATLGEHVPADRVMDSWHLVTPGGRVHSAGRALPELLRRLPGGRPLAALAARFPRAADRAYFAVADRRSAIGRLIPAGARRRASARVARRAAP
jgi:predicted DCC family thiol-disulfide oxidoreductase YuxK